MSSDTGAAEHDTRRSPSRPGGPTNRTAAGPTGQAERDASVRKLDGRLFDGSGRDRDVTVTHDVVRSLGDEHILWVDLVGANDATIDQLAGLFELRRESVRTLGQRSGRPRVALFGDYLQLWVTTVETDGDQERSAELAMIAGPKFVITLHEEAVEFLRAFHEHLRGDTMIGRLDGPAFLAALLDWHLSGYFQVIEALERAADRLDHRALHPRSERDLLADLVRLRRRISTLRRELAPHREVVAALTRSELSGLGDADDTVHFRALGDRLERAIDSVDTARELVLGSFDVHMTRTAQRTNEVMKVLTLASVILLPGSMIAGIMGMNFQVGFFDEPTWFWVVMGAIVLIAVTTLVVARAKRWV